MINQEEEPIQAFVKLGLTCLQAKIYITLLKTGKNGTDARSISQASAIARQDVYRLLPKLEKIGLVERIIAKPTKYKPIELEQAVSILSKKREEDFLDMQKSAQEMLDSFVAQHADYNQYPTLDFVITSERTLFLKRVQDGVAQSQKSIDVIYTEERLRAILYHTIDEFEKALARGVKIRIITTNRQGNPPDANFDKLLKNPSIQLHTAKDIPVGLIIFDKKEVKFRTGPNMVPILWTNNRNVLKMVQIYFDHFWK